MSNSASRRVPPSVPGFTGLLKLAARMTLRDARAGELRLLMLALVVAVAAVGSVGFLSDRVGRALERDAGQMLGGDLVLEADEPIPAAFLEAARGEGLAVARTWQFPSMASAGDAMQLAAVKAVEPGYPLRGALRVADAPGGPAVAARGIPQAGTAWVDAQLLAATGLHMGDTIALGNARFRIARVIAYEPDRGMRFVNVAPRVMIAAADLPATGLVTIGSRIGYGMAVAGEPQAVARYSGWLRPRLTRGQDIATLETGRPQARLALDRAQRFLSLVALLAAMISAVAVALAARRFMLRHVDGTAVMRCLGATRAQVAWLLLVEFTLLAAAASILGGILGYVVHEGLVAALGALIQADLPPATPLPAVQGALAGGWLLLGFALPALARLRRVSPAGVLRREFRRVPGRSLAGYAVGTAGFAGLLLWFAGDLRLGASVAGGFMGACAIFGLLAWGCLAALTRLRTTAATPPALRFALAGLVRRRGAGIVQICALAVGLMALLLLAMTRTDLLAGWQRTLPPDAPNRFLINIQAGQRQAVMERLRQAGLDGIELHPMVRGRLLAINGRTVSPADYQEPRARRLVDREFNLSYARAVPPYNRIAEGRPLDPDAAEVSMESGIADTLGIALGDTLRFDVAGREIDVAVTSLRAVDWDTMRVNFFAIMTPQALQGMPQTWITSFHLPDASSGVTRRLLRDFPNLTVFDVDTIVGQLQSVLDRVIAAVQLLFLFTLAAGVLVLASALAATRDERMREAALMRALGATRRQLARAQRIELLALGGVAGLLAAGGASALAWILASQVFDFHLEFSVWPWFAGLAAGMGSAWAGGATALRGVLRTPPLVTLREA